MSQGDFSSQYGDRMSSDPLVVDIRRDSDLDGPGIRSVVFFKGCPLRCPFCHNPEAQSPLPEIGFFPQDCIGCGSCVQACPRGAIDLSDEGRIIRELCDACGKCADACPSSALKVVGKAFSIEQLTEVLLRDQAYYRVSGGGVTFSGGECAMYPDFVGRLARNLKSHGIHMAIETSGYFDYASVAEHLLPYVDLILFDLKFSDESDHLNSTGKSNKRIINNLRRLLQDEGLEVLPRIPVIPGLTATRNNLAGIVEILRELGVRRFTLLPYNPLGMEKRKAFGRGAPQLPERLMSPQEEEAIRRLVEDLCGS